MTIPSKTSCVTTLYILTVSVLQVTAAESLTINSETNTYDYYPSSASADDGSTWLAWHGYSKGRDQIIVRHVGKEGELNQRHNVSDAGAIHGPPTIVADSKTSASVIWTTKSDDRWRVVIRQFRDGNWLNAVTLSNIQHDAIYPTAHRVAGGKTLVAWSESSNGRIQIRGTLLEKGRPGRSFPISSGSFDAFRPVLVQHGSETWAIWDQYERPNYSIHARRLLPQLGDIERVSPPDEFCLTPTALPHSNGMYVAWLRKIDVQGGPGVVSQWHTLHVARRSGMGWKQIETTEGQTAAAELTQGLMAKIDPKPIATGGYLGPRTRPALVADGERVWLLWERKSNHRGSTPTVSGDLIGRPIIEGRWGKRVILAQKRIDYHAIDPPVVRNGMLCMLASRMPKSGLRRYELFDVSLKESTWYQQDAWTGWSPVTLPVQSESPARQTISAAGKRYKLYWADMHCHNGLTADAEGEPDEMHAYARDRAGLDVVVFTNNDFYNVPLTQYEFELGNLFAKIFSAKRQTGTRPLLSLPGYEWTSRIPGKAGASLADSGNWLPPYRNRSYPNHRSVIYPPSGGPLVHFTEVGNDIAHLNQAVQKAGGITLSQHNAFKLSGHSVEVGFELTSGWSNYIASHPQLFHRPLNNGSRLAFTANGDTHRRAPGLSGALTGIYAESLTAESILDALRSRRCFATMGSKISIDARADGALMGEDVDAADNQVKLTLHAVGTRPIVRVVLIRDGKEIHRVDGTGKKEFQTSFTDEKLLTGTHWYYWRISQQQTAPVLPGNLMPAHGHLAWSTPHWVVVK